ncbi:MAG: hypothetical protein ACE366_13535 [Bradymonadia bacterium]
MTSAHPPQDGDLATLWGEARDAVKQALKAATAAEKALKAVGDPATSPVAALKALDALSALSCAPIEQATVDALKGAIEQARGAWRMQFLNGLKAEAQSQGVAFARLTQSEVRLGEATAVLDLDKGVAKVCYAREPLTEVSAEPRALVSGVGKAMAELTSGGFDAAEVFEQITGAYRALLGRKSLPGGERVFLVDLIPELLPARQSDAFWKRQDPRRLITVTRARLAWELDQLQKARALEQGGWRIVLGTATAGSASQKKKVLFLESGPGGGQYYLSFTLKRTGA